jgi:5-formyltetrahydrofolate cyclo-ligase
VSKSSLRSAALAARDALDSLQRRTASTAIAHHALPLVASLAPHCLAGYVAMRSEVDVSGILDALHRRGVAIGLPVILPGQTLAFHRHEPGDALVPGGFGTRVPGRDAPVVEPDALLVPLVGFDRRGTRLGYGKGHYDRAIAAMHARGRRPTLVGIAFAAQEVDNIPAEPHDVRLDVIVTEDGIIDMRGRPSG